MTTNLNGRPIIEEMKRDKRLNLVITEKLKNELQAGARLKQTSVNSLIIEICQQWIFDNFEALSQFNELSEKLINKRG